MTSNPVNRGYFAIGVEGISKPMNLGAVLRTAHAFHASFCFTIGACFNVRDVLASDTSVAFDSMPVNIYEDLGAFQQPIGARIVGSERAKDCLREFLKTEFEGGRHQKRIEKM